MEDFLKQFRKNLEDHPEPLYNERDWHDMARRLDHDSQKPTRPFAWWWAAAALAFLLLGSNILFFREIREANQKLAVLETRVDTVYNTRVVYMTDTVYMNNNEYASTVTTGHSAKQKSAYENKWKSTILDFAHVFNPSSTITDPYSKPNDNTVAAYWQQAQNEKFSNREIPIDWRNKDISFVEMLGLNQLDIDDPNLTLNDAGPFDKKQKKNLRYYLYHMQPKSFSAGLLGGWVYPFTDKIVTEQGYSFGLEGNTWLSPNLNLWINASFSNYQFQSDTMDITLGVPKKVFEDDEIFIDADGKRPVLQYSMGMQYYFNADKKWRPFLGMGIASAQLLSYNINYEYFDKNTNVEMDVKQKINGRQLNSTFALLHAGIEYKITDQWSWQLRTGYRAHFAETNFHSPKLFNVLTGVNYHFK